MVLICWKPALPFQHLSWNQEEIYNAFSRQHLVLVSRLSCWNVQFCRELLHYQRRVPSRRKSFEDNFWGWKHDIEVTLQVKYHCISLCKFLDAIHIRLHWNGPTQKQDWQFQLVMREIHNFKNNGNCFGVSLLERESLPGNWWLLS